jgi:hypothetical protein
MTATQRSNRLIRDIALLKKAPNRITKDQEIYRFASVSASSGNVSHYMVLIRKEQTVAAQIQREIRIDLIDGIPVRK